MTDEDVQALQYAASMLHSGFPLVAFLQLARVYGQALAQIADAEVRLFHLYVHEPLIREGVPGVQMAEEMEHLARDLLPLASPLMDYVHQRFLQHYIEQDVVGHMEIDTEGDVDLGRLRVAIAFCDLAGYTRYTEEEGEDEAVSFVERFVEAVVATLPDDARVIKTIGDEVMIVGQDVQALTDWAVGFQELFTERPEPRIGIHYGADALPRRGLLRARGEHRLAGGGPGPGRRGAGHRLRGGARVREPTTWSSRASGTSSSRASTSRGSCAARCCRTATTTDGGAGPGGRPRKRAGARMRAAAGDALGRRRLGLPAGRGPAAGGAGRRAARELRPARAAEQDEAHCRALCERLGVELTVERAWLPEGGNVQAHARDARYRLAERVARGDYAAAHTASDQAETVLYRLAVSPGRRALLGMEPRRGRLVRPLLEATREDTRAYCRGTGLSWREDESNEDPRFARARVRHGLLAALREVAPGGGGHGGRDRAPAARGGGGAAAPRRGPPSTASAAAPWWTWPRCAPCRAPPRAWCCARWPSAPRAGRVPLPGERVDAVLALGEGGGTSALDLGGGLRAVCEYGMLRLDAAGAPPAPEPVDLPVPGHAPASAPGRCARRAIPARWPWPCEGPLTVRAWREGDRIRPLGLGGTKTLGDLFTDRKVPRELRRTLPVVVRGDEVVWVAGRGAGRALRRGGGRGRGPSGCPLASRAREGSRDRRDPRPAGRAGAPGGRAGRADLGRLRRAQPAARRRAEGRDVLPSDLMRRLDTDCEVDFMAVASYGSSTGSSGVVRILKDLDVSIEGRDVLIIEDIVDSGLTLSYLLRTLRARDPATVEVCALLTKPERRKVDLPIRYTGFEIPNKFVIGYGLDHAERFRNLPYVAALVEPS